MNGPDGERDDAALVAASLAGEDRAFTALMRRYKDPLYRFVRRYVGDADEAYDLVQEAFVAAWSALPSFDARRPFFAWLRRVALNKCRDWSRRRNVRRFFFGALPIESPQAQAAASDPAGPDQTSEDALNELDSAIANLPATLKEALLLSVFEGLSHKDAGELLGVSAKAIETRVYRAKQLLISGVNSTR